MGIEPLAFTSIEEIWNYQLDGTGVSLADFKTTGMVPLAEQALYQPQENLKFKTPSGKIELLDRKSVV